MESRHDDSGPAGEERDESPETSADDVLREETELDVEEAAAADPDEDPDSHSSARIPEDV